MRNTRLVRLMVHHAPPSALGLEAELESHDVVGTFVTVFPASVREAVST